MCDLGIGYARDFPKVFRELFMRSFDSHFQCMRICFWLYKILTSGVHYL